MVLLGVVIIRFVIGGLTDVSGMVGFDFDLQIFSVDTVVAALQHSSRLLRWRMAPLEAPPPRPRPRPGVGCRVGVVDVAAPPVRLATKYEYPPSCSCVVMDLVPVVRVCRRVLTRRFCKQSGNRSGLQLRHYLKYNARKQAKVPWVVSQM
jgi:hypothetical protein